ncbi:hypothetical protein CBM2634_B60247 [Cupriavidus taiwanensis]|uniref:Uncharacterized protein n=1 Tax=Cupriavidus taiwanensis TaxID=164546 RepID=A0A375JB75_9BURK|nr:hypothetical protein CBM2634_B60247 [Cupriavidus taiwanensis]
MASPRMAGITSETAILPPWLYVSFFRRFDHSALWIRTSLKGRKETVSDRCGAVQRIRTSIQVSLAISGSHPNERGPNWTLSR